MPHTSATGWDGGSLIGKRYGGPDATVELLRQLGVDYGQGYHLGRPTAVHELLPALPDAVTPVSATQLR